MHITGVECWLESHITARSTESVPPTGLIYVNPSIKANQEMSANFAPDNQVCWWAKPSPVVQALQASIDECVTWRPETGLSIFDH